MAEIRVEKHARRLILRDLSGEREFPIALGGASEGDKHSEGDLRTPEGVYYVVTRNEKSKYYRSLGLSYPNAEDALEALKDGRIDQATCERICEAARQQKRPPWDTALGGFIMIHGGGTDGDWTHGCVAVENAAMDILWRECPLGTKVILIP